MKANEFGQTKISRGGSPTKDIVEETVKNSHLEAVMKQASPDYGPRSHLGHEVERHRARDTEVWHKITRWD